MKTKRNNRGNKNRKTMKGGGDNSRAEENLNTGVNGVFWKKGHGEGILGSKGWRTRKYELKKVNAPDKEYQLKYYDGKKEKGIISFNENDIEERLLEQQKEKEYLSGEITDNPAEAVNLGNEDYFKTHKMYRISGISEKNNEKEYDIFFGSNDPFKTHKILQKGGKRGRKTRKHKRKTRRRKNKKRKSRTRSIRRQ